MLFNLNLNFFSMKKLNLKPIPAILIFGIVISLMACKKESKDLFAEAAEADPIIAGIETQSENPENTSNTKVNEEGITLLSDSDSLSDARTAFAINEEGKYSYKLRLEKGKTYKLYTQTVNTNTQTFRGKSATENATTIEDVSFRVLQVQNGNYKMEATFDNSKMVVSGGGKSVTVDANKPKPSNPVLQGGWLVQKARKGKKITFQMDDKGTVSNVNGFDKIHAEFKKLLQKEVSGEEFNQIYQMVTQQLNGETFKMQIEQGMVKFPKGGARIGQTWSENSNSKEGKVSFTLEKVENGKAFIKVSSSYPPQKESQSEGGITATMSATMSTKGSIVLDTQSGWIDTGKLTDTMNQTQTMSNGKETQSSSIKSLNVTTINP